MKKCKWCNIIFQGDICPDCGRLILHDMLIDARDD